MKANRADKNVIKSLLTNAFKDNQGVRSVIFPSGGIIYFNRW